MTRAEGGEMFAATGTATQRRHDRILFGSCNSHHYKNHLWKSIVARNASAFVWAGDAVYGDDFEPVVPRTADEDDDGSILATLKSWIPRKMKVKPATPERLRELYQMQIADKGYQELLNQENLTILGVLDDHDYGHNNGDRTYAHRIDSAMAHVDFLQTKRPHSNLTLMKSRAAAGLGMYGVYVFDFDSDDSPLLSDEEAGLDPETPQRTVPLSQRSVAIFLLDIRSNKTPWRKQFDKRFQLDYDGDFLGVQQWTWLEQALNRSTASVNIIVQGLQVHADRFFDGSIVEDWSRFPTAQHRLYQAILKSQVQVPIIVSGDVHMAELLRKDCYQSHQADVSFQRMLLEVTTSGMTHSWGTRICARPKSSFGCQTPWFLYSLGWGMNWAHWSGAWTDLVYLDANSTNLHEQSRPGVQYSLDRNFAEFEFDWEDRQLIIRILGEGEDKPLLSTKWNFDMLSNMTTTQQVPPDAFDHLLPFQYRNSSGFSTQNDWVCQNHRGKPSFLLKLYGVLSPVSVAASLIALPMVLPILIARCLLRPRRNSRRRK